MAFEFTEEYLLNSYKRNLEKTFPDEQFLDAEIDGIQQALINSLRWSAIELALKKAKMEETPEIITQIETYNVFATQGIGEEDIIWQIVHTSGLGKDVATHCLKSIQTMVVNAIEDYGAVKIEHIGTIKSLSDDNYLIDLVTELYVSPAVNATSVTAYAPKEKTA